MFNSNTGLFFFLVLPLSGFGIRALFQPHKIARSSSSLKESVYHGDFLFFKGLLKLTCETSGPALLCVCGRIP